MQPTTQMMRLIEAAVAVLAESGQAGVEVTIVHGPGVHDATRDYQTRLRYLPAAAVVAPPGKRH